MFCPFLETLTLIPQDIYLYVLRTQYILYIVRQQQPGKPSKNQ